MPSSDTSDGRIEDAAFTRLDLDDATGVRHRPTIDWRSTVLLGGLLVVVLAFLYDYYLLGPRPLLLSWDLSRSDWLFVVSFVLVVRYVVLPIVVERRRTRRYWRRLRRDRLGVAALAYLALISGLSAFVPAVFGAGRVDLLARLQPPVFFTARIEGVTGGYTCVGPMTDGLCHGTWAYPLGTTQMGEGVARIVLNGMSISLKTGFAAAMIMVVIATGIGLVAGFSGGRIDGFLMRYVDLQQAVPAFFVYILLSYFIVIQSMFLFVLVFGLLNWGGLARIIRGEVIQRREDGYVRAAESAGASKLYLIRRHLLANTSNTVVPSITRQIPYFILAQIALAYMQLNEKRLRSIGELLRRAFHAQHAQAWTEKWWVATSIVVAVLLTVVAFYVLGDVFRDVLDPREEG